MISRMISIIYLHCIQCLRTQKKIEYIDFSHLQMIYKSRPLTRALQQNDLLTHFNCCSNEET